MADDNTRIGLFVADTGPLITLAAAESLDYLKFPKVPVVIPDAVFYEATFDDKYLGAQNIIDWVRDNREVVEVAPTQAFANFLASNRRDPNYVREKDLGERAAAELIFDGDRLDKSELGVLLCEETNILKAVAHPQMHKIVSLTSMDYLRLLETHGHIQSADYVFNRAQEKGRHPYEGGYLSDHDPEIRDAVHDILKKAHGPSMG